MSLLAVGLWYAKRFQTPVPTAQSHYERGVEFAGAGDIHSAIVELKNAVQLLPEHKEARATLGELYLLNREPVSAEKQLRQAILLGTQSSEIELALLRSQLMQRRFDVVLSQSFIVDAEESELLMLRGEAQLGLGMSEQARETFSLILEDEPNKITARRALARVALADGELEKAESAILVALQASDNDVESWLIKGDVSAAMREFTRAEAEFSKALALQDSHRPARLKLAESQLELGKGKAAEETLSPLLQRGPRDPLVNYLSAVAAAIQEDFERAKSSLRVVLSRVPNDINTKLLLGSIHYQEKDFEAAQHEISAVLDAVPEDVPTRRLLARVQLAADRPEAAIQTLLPGLQSTPRDSQLLTLLANAYVANEQADVAAPYFEQVFELAPNVAYRRAGQAVRRLGVGDVDKGITSLHKAIELNPDVVQGDFALVVAHMQRGEFDEALRAGRRYAESLPESPLPRHLIGRIYEAKEDVESARSFYEEALGLDASFASSAINLARLELSRGGTAAAREILEATLVSKPHEPRVVLALWRLSSPEERAGAGLARLELARQHNPKDVSTRLVLAGVYLRLGRPPDALEVAREARKLRPRQPRTALLLGRSLLAAGQPQKALEILQGLARRQPESVPVLFQLGRAQQAARKLEAAQSSFERVIELEPKHLNAKAALGRLALARGKTDEALALAQRLQLEHPKAAQGHLLEGRVLTSMENIDGALDAFERAVSVTPGPATILALSGAQYLGGAEELSEQTLVRWLEQHPDATAVRLQLGSLRLARGHIAESIAAYEELLNQQPQNVTALNNLANLYQDTNITRAMAFAERAVELAPDHPAVLDTFGWLLVLNGQSDKALAALRLAVNRAPRVPTHRYHLAVALSRHDGEAEAIELLSGVLENDLPFPERAQAKALLAELR